MVTSGNEKKECIEIDRERSHHTQASPSDYAQPHGLGDYAYRGVSHTEYTWFASPMDTDVQKITGLLKNKFVLLNPTKRRSIRRPFNSII